MPAQSRAGSSPIKTTRSWQEGKEASSRKDTPFGPRSPGPPGRDGRDGVRLPVFAGYDEPVVNVTPAVAHEPIAAG